MSILIAVFPAARSCLASGDDNLQYWTAGGISVDLGEDWTVGFEEVLCFLSDSSLYYHHSDIALVYKGLAD